MARLGVSGTVATTAILFAAVCFAVFPAIPLIGIILSLCALTYLSWRWATAGIMAACTLSGTAIWNAGAYTYQEAAFGSGRAACYIVMAVGCTAIGITIARNPPGLPERTADDTAASKQSTPAQDIGRQLHNHTANDLANIVLLTEQALEQHDDTDTHLHMIHDLSLDALQQTRQAIDSLESANQNQHDANIRRLASFASFIEERKAQLSQLGHEGHIAVDANEAHQGLEYHDAQFLTAISKELFTNLAKYGNPNMPYAVLIAIRLDCCILEMSNGTYGNRDMDAKITSPLSLSGESGLAYFRTTVLKRGGTWECSHGDGRWNLRLSMPLSHEGDNASAKCQGRQ